MIHCDGICKKYSTRSGYKMGVIFCSGCGRFMKSILNFCPCCLGKIHTKPRKKLENKIMLYNN